MTGRGRAWVLALLAAGCSRPQPASNQQAADAPSRPPAAAPAPAAQADPCASAANQLELNLCKAAHARRADSLEVAQYDSATRWLKQRQAADRLPLLDASDQAWKVYREAQCKAEAGGYAGGSLAPTILADCQARLANLRAEELKKVYAE